MAEVVEFRMEAQIPVLEMLKKSQLFTPEEIKAVAKNRKDFEYKLARVTKIKGDTLKYIQYELDLMKLINQRRVEKGISTKKTDLDYAIANHINSLFNQVVKRYPNDSKLWFSHIKFCKQQKFYTCASRVIDQFLCLHNDKPTLFVFAADFEFNFCNSTEKARKYLMSGLRKHKDSKVLYKACFKLELEHANTLRNQILDQKKEIDPDDPILKGKAAEVIYDSSVNTIHDVEFVIELLKLAKEYTFTGDLQNRIYVDLSNQFSDKEIAWDALATRELENRDESTTKERITKCASMYEAAVKILNTETMWQLYIDKMLELLDSPDELYPRLKKNCLTSALIGANAAGKLTEKYYLVWVERVHGRAERLYNILQTGTEKLPQSVLLWFHRLKFHLKTGDEANALTVFNKALTCLTETAGESMRLWKHMLQYYQITDMTGKKSEELFERGLKWHPDVAKELKPMYIEWLAFHRGIATARKVYQDLCLVPPFDLELHRKMIELEDAQAVQSIKSTRKCHFLATQQFGETEPSVWISYIQFEQNLGKPESVPKLYSEAVNTLKVPHVDEFISAYSLNKADFLSQYTPGSRAEIFNYLDSQPEKKKENIVDLVPGCKNDYFEDMET